MPTANMFVRNNWKLISFSVFLLLIYRFDSITCCSPGNDGNDVGGDDGDHQMESKSFQNNIILCGCPIIPHDISPYLIFKLHLL